MIDPRKKDQTPRQGPPPEDPERTPESTLPTSGQSPGKPDSTEADRAAAADPKPNYPPKLI